MVAPRGKPRERAGTSALVKRFWCSAMRSVSPSVDTAGAGKIKIAEVLRLPVELGASGVGASDVASFRGSEVRDFSGERLGGIEPSGDPAETKHFSPSG